MTIDRRRLRGVYARLRGLSKALPTDSTGEPGIGRDLDQLVREFGEITGEDVHSFLLPAEAFYRSTYADRVRMELVRSKLSQVLSYIEYVFHVNDNIIEIGTLYNSIKDPELKRRCSDLLSAPSDFDRVINQATLVLEDRLRTKSQIEAALVGVGLVSRVLNPDPARTILIVSDSKDEQEGIHAICRGLMLAFRNATHHHLTDEYSREDALKICAFVDSMLGIIDKAQIKI